MRILNISGKFVGIICKRKGKAKHLATTFSAARGPIRGGKDCGTNMAPLPQVVGIAALQEFYKNDRFLTVPCGFFHELSA
jgi:hypothetical protein